MLRIFDAHVHLFDCEANTYAFLEHEDRSFKSIAGDYSTLPRRYLTDVRQSHADRQLIRGVRASLRCLSGDCGRFSAVERDDMFRGTAADWFKQR